MALLGDPALSSSASVEIVSASPAHPSRCWCVARRVGEALLQAELAVGMTSVRDLPAQELVLGRRQAPRVREALAAIERADALVIITPVYNGAYSGLLKVFLDLVPQRGLEGKLVLPLALGGSPAHTFAVDHALRPVLSSLGARHVMANAFLLDALSTVSATGELQLSAELTERLDAAIDELAAGVRFFRTYAPQRGLRARM
jgi:FMN reductase